jgi:hypothetical protein
MSEAPGGISTGADHTSQHGAGARGRGSAGAAAAQRQLCPHCFGAPAALPATAPARGLSLVSARAIALRTPHVVTEARGRARGRVWPLVRRVQGAVDTVERGPELEPVAMRAAVAGHGRMLRYELAAFADGLYEAEAGPEGERAYFEVIAGRIGREFDRRDAFDEVRRGCGGATTTTTRVRRSL